MNQRATEKKSDQKANRQTKKGEVGLKSVNLNDLETEKKNKGRND